MANEKKTDIASLAQDELAKLSAENAELLAKIQDYEVLKETVQRITAENATLLSGNTELKELNGRYFKDLEHKDISLKEAEALILEQQAALSASQVISDVPVITVNKKKYKVVAPAFNVDGVNRTASDLEKDETLAKYLVEKGSSVLELVK